MIALISLLSEFKGKGITVDFKKIKDPSMHAYFSPEYPNTITVNRYIFDTYKPEQSRLEWTVFILMHEYVHYLQYQEGLFDKAINMLGQKDGLYFLDIDADLKAIDFCSKFGILKPERFSSYLKMQLEYSKLTDIKEYHDRQRNKIRDS